MKMNEYGSCFPIRDAYPKLDAALMALKGQILPKVTDPLMHGRLSRLAVKAAYVPSEIFMLGDMLHGTIYEGASGFDWHWNNWVPTKVFLYAQPSLKSMFYTAVHEMAHVITPPEEGHGETWAANARLLGIAEKAYKGSHLEIPPMSHNQSYLHRGETPNNWTDPTVLAWVEAQADSLKGILSET